MELYRNMIASGAKVIKPLEYRREREKLSGAMWTGTAVLEINDCEFEFGMSHHFTQEGCVTFEQVLEQLWLVAVNPKENETLSKSVFDDFSTVYNTHYDVLLDHDCVLVHPKGWRNDLALEDIVIAFDDKIKRNSHKLTKADIHKLTSKGFMLLYKK